MILLCERSWFYEGWLVGWVSGSVAKELRAQDHQAYRVNVLRAACLLLNADKAGTLLVVSSSVGLVSGVASFLTIGS